MATSRHDRNTLRINAGLWRGRKLRFPDATELRPTPDRVRETVFNWLGQDLTGLCCLDLFAGSGALGFEALSRGARHVTFVERSRVICRYLDDTAAMLDASARCEVLCCDAIEFLRRRQRIASEAGPLPDGNAGARFDVVFLDPPYGQGWIETILPRLEPVVASSTRLYFEAESSPARLAGWTIMRNGRAGAVHFGLAQKGNP